MNLFPALEHPYRPHRIVSTPQDLPEGGRLLPLRFGSARGAADRLLLPWTVLGIAALGVPRAQHPPDPVRLLG